MGHFNLQKVQHQISNQPRSVILSILRDWAILLQGDYNYLMRWNYPKCHSKCKKYIKDAKAFKLLWIKNGYYFEYAHLLTFKPEQGLDSS